MQDDRVACAASQSKRIVGERDYPDRNVFVEAGVERKRGKLSQPPLVIQYPLAAPQPWRGGGRADGSIGFFNKRWLEYAGLSLDQALGWGWTVAIHSR